jgi:hypothetical protein
MGKTVKVKGYKVDEHKRRGTKVKGHPRKGTTVEEYRVDGYTRAAPKAKKGKSKPSGGLL